MWIVLNLALCLNAALLSSDLISIAPASSEDTLGLDVALFNIFLIITASAFFEDLSHA